MQLVKYVFSYFISQVVAFYHRSSNKFTVVNHTSALQAASSASVQQSVRLLSLALYQKCVRCHIQRRRSSVCRLWPRSRCLRLWSKS